MIVGVGTDICKIARIEKLLQKHGEKFVERILTPAEQQHFAAKNNNPTFLAGRYAAKEACSKALGCGIGSKLSLQNIEISYQESGQPVITLVGEFSGENQENFAELKLHLSISHEEDNAVAFVVAEK